MKRLDLAGKIFGQLTVIGYSHSHIQPSGQKRAMWDVKCSCGTLKKMSTSNLTSGSNISCGCYFNKIRKNGTFKKEPGEANFNYKYLSYKTRAKNHKKSLDFKLTKEQFREIILNNCHYCGCTPSMHHTNRSFNGLFISNGIDRLDSNVGYIYENCVSCCKICNIMKNNLSYDNFIKQIARIHSHVKKRF